MDQGPFPPLHPDRPQHPLERALRETWEAFTGKDKIIAGPGVKYSQLQPGVQYDSCENIFQPYPYGRMTDRDRMIAAEVFQWLGSGVGYNLLCRAFDKAGGKVFYDDYAPKVQDVKIKCVDHLGNVSYILRGKHGWQCILVNGREASLLYGGVGVPKEADFRYCLDSCKTPESLLKTVKKAGHASFAYSIWKPGDDEPKIPTNA